MPVPYVEDAFDRAAGRLQYPRPSRQCLPPMPAPRYDDAFTVTLPVMITVPAVGRCAAEARAAADARSRAAACRIQRSRAFNRQRRACSRKNNRRRSSPPSAYLPCLSAIFNVLPLPVKESGHVPSNCCCRWSHPQAPRSCLRRRRFGCRSGFPKSTALLPGFTVMVSPRTVIRQNDVTGHNADRPYGIEIHDAAFPPSD